MNVPYREGIRDGSDLTALRSPDSFAFALTPSIERAAGFFHTPTGHAEKSFHVREAAVGRITGPICKFAFSRLRMGFRGDGHVWITHRKSFSAWGMEHSAWGMEHSAWG